MNIANLSTQPNAQPDVEREPAERVAPTDAAAGQHSEDGPVQGSLARSVEDLRNAASAIGPVNFLPKTAPAEDLMTLDAATAILNRLVNSRAG